LEQYFGSETRLSVSGFFNDTQDLIGITPSNDPADTREYFSNLEQARTLGMELEGEYRTRSGWLARASYTLQRTEDVQSGAELSNSPQHLLKGNLVAPLWRDRVFAGIEAQYTSRARTLPGRGIGFADPFWVVNFTLYSRELVKGLEASATLYNLFDSRYSYPAGSEFLPALIEQDGRSFRAKLTYKF
ncbi:MAG: TonB-dependent receptor, partial [Verrucomicrobiales bacterium]|nr:TonB-dependent receptor [Verrucomicrobiales bacterium]